MKKLLLLTCLLPILAFAQGWYPGGGRSMSMANASVALNDEWSFFNNPGALGAQDKFSAGLSYENRFLLKELQSQKVKVSEVTEGNEFGMSIETKTEIAPGDYIETFEVVKK